MNVDINKLTKELEDKEYNFAKWTVKELREFSSKNKIKIPSNVKKKAQIIEFLQKISGFGRTAEFLDLVYDMAGCLIIVIFLIIYGSIRRFGFSKD